MTGIITFGMARPRPGYLSASPRMLARTPRMASQTRKAITGTAAAFTRLMSQFQSSSGSGWKIADKPDPVIGDGGDRQPFDRLLQPQLVLRALVHRLQQVAVLPLDDHLGLGAHQVAGTGDAFGQPRKPFGKGAAAVERRRHPPAEEPGDALEALQPRELQAGDAVHQDRLIGLRRGKPVGGLRIDFLEIGGLRREHRQKLLDLAVRLLDLRRQVGRQPGDRAFDPAERGAVLAHRGEADQGQRR